MSELLALIAARGGSKSVPRKNVALIGGKPLIAWTIEAARQSRAVTRVVVTTDDPEIAEISRTHGAEVPFMRPADLATDTSPSLAAIRHALQWLDGHEGYRPELTVNLQPTSPLRTAADIDQAAALLVARGADAVVSVARVDQHPYWMQTIDAGGWLRDFVSQEARPDTRQALPPVYVLNGAIYLAPRDVVLALGWFTPRTAAYVMPTERSIDIDTPLDFQMAGMMLAASRDERGAP